MLRVITKSFRHTGNLKIKHFKNLHVPFGASVASAVASTATLASFSTAAYPSETFLTGTGNAYMDEMYHTWKKNPEKVHKSWDVYFTQIEKNALPGEAFVIPPTIQPMIHPPVKSGMPSKDVPGQRNDALGLSYLIRAYQVFGHDAADLDPLGIYTGRNIPQLDYRQYGFTEADLNRVISVPSNFSSGVTGFLEELVEGSSMTLGNIIKRLNETYCNHIGVEYMHILGTEKCNWIRSKIEHLNHQEMSKEKKLHILERLAFSDGFEKVCQHKFATTKRFGLDGGETLVPGLKFLVDRSTELGVERMCFGMPHRGRLNVLCNVLRKPADQLFREFMGTHFDIEKYKTEVTEWAAYGDVKYHLGTSCDRTYPDGRQVHLSLLANPSHLEAVDPVVEGKVRATQYYLGNTPEAHNKVLPIILHGDAAFSGQGVVYETMNFSELPKYHNGGTIHVIVNNQVGFTTDPKYSRSSQSCSDLGKAFGIPIFHVNSDYPEDVVKVFELAAEWRQRFHLDAIINFTCYRRYGHNEVDNPEFTQPLMYQKIQKMQSSLDKYKEHLVKTNVATAEECDSIVKIPYDIFSQSFEASKSLSAGSREDWLSCKWESFKSPRQQSRIRETGVDLKTLQRIGNKICDIPTTFNIHRQLRRIMENKRKAVNEGHGIDWGTAEALAFGSLLLEGNHVRISGQDVERGTFSHRHAVLHDQKTGETYTPLNHLAVRAIPSAPLEFVRGQGLQAELVASNSSLSEYGVLGFELGYSLENPNSLVIWEAQFGDFANGAQTIIDQFLSSGEAKWMRQCGLVVLLPHGYEGQGAEHSSCRLERFLQMSDDEPDVVPCMDRNSRMQIQQTNWQIVYCSTPANYFHALRRQIHRDFRKPLIAVMPKSLLRSKESSSSLTDMTIGESFRRIMPDPLEKELKDVKRIVFCSGKVYYELAQGRKDKDIKNVALVRVEQICPFPFDRVAKEMKKHPNAEIVWVQEEPRNMGCWTYVEPRIITALTQINKDTKRHPRYVGRATAAAPSTGYSKVHVLEQKQVVDDALA